MHIRVVALLRKKKKVCKRVNQRGLKKNRVSFCECGQTGYQRRKTSHSCLDGLFFFGPRDNTPQTMTWKHGREEKHHCVVDRLVSFEARKGAHTRETPRLTPTGCTLRLIDVQEKQEPLKGPDRFLLRSSQWFKEPSKHRLWFVTLKVTPIAPVISDCSHKKGTKMLDFLKSEGEN